MHADKLFSLQRDNTRPTVLRDSRRHRASPNQQLNAANTDLCRTRETTRPSTTRRTFNSAATLAEVRTKEDELNRLRYLLRSPLRALAERPARRRAPGRRRRGLPSPPLTHPPSCAAAATGSRSSSPKSKPLT